MAQPNLLKLAKQGNPKAIAALLNRSLQPKGITARVGLKNDCLQVLLESAQIPDQQEMVTFINRGLAKLGVESITTVKVYGRQTGAESSAWNEKFEIASPLKMPSSTEEVGVSDRFVDSTADETPEPVSSYEETFSNPDQTPDKDFSSYQMLQRASRPVSQNGEMPSNAEQTDVQESQTRSATPRNVSSRQRVGPLSVGNVVSAGLRLYRDRFKLYFGLAFAAYAWILVPIYGWAKFSAISALISRLAFSELIERPETVSEARRHVMPRMWSFLLAGILVGLILIGIAVGFGVVFGIVAIGFAVIGQNLGTGAAIALAVVGVIAFIAFLIGYIRFLCRLFIVEMPLAIESNVDATSAINRSWQLTKGFVSRLQWVVFVAFLVTLPISIVVQIATSIFKAVLTAVFSTDSPTFALLYFILVLALTIISGALLIPFWQTIKAVIYYDLRSRREGLGLEIRDSQ